MRKPTARRVYEAVKAGPECTDSYGLFERRPDAVAAMEVAMREYIDGLREGINDGVFSDEVIAWQLGHFKVLTREITPASRALLEEEDRG